MPLHPGLRGIAAQGVWGKKLAGEYRRSAEGLAARGSNMGLCQLIRKSRQSTENLIAQKQPACQETLAVFTGRCPAPRAARPSRAGYSGDMRDGQCFTAARRKALRLAALAGGRASRFEKSRQSTENLIAQKTASVPRNAGCFLYCWKIIPNFDVPAVPLGGFRRFGHSGSRNRRRYDPYIPRVPALPRPGWGNRSGQWSPWR